jgi:hypothetical protein
MKTSNTPTRQPAQRAHERRPPLGAPPPTGTKSVTAKTSTGGTATNRHKELTSKDLHWGHRHQPAQRAYEQRPPLGAPPPTGTKSVTAKTSTGAPPPTGTKSVTAKTSTGGTATNRHKELTSKDLHMGAPPPNGNRRNRNPVRIPKKQMHITKIVTVTKNHKRARAHEHIKSEPGAFKAELSARDAALYNALAITRQPPQAATNAMIKTLCIDKIPFRITTRNKIFANYQSLGIYNVESVLKPKVDNKTAKAEQKTLTHGDFCAHKRNSQHSKNLIGLIFLLCTISTRS